jgi:hypothetical protein
MNPKTYTSGSIWEFGVDVGYAEAARHLSAVSIVFTSGKKRFGPLVQIDSGSALELCGEGYSTKTVRVRFDGKYFFVFKADLRCLPADLAEKINPQEKRSSVVGDREERLAGVYWEAAAKRG